MAKSIEFLVITPPNHGMIPHAPDNGQRTGNEDKLHDGVVNGDEIREQIQVTCQKHHCVELLRLA
uniref:Uncharacterized protein n=1 Tax=Lotus japonicus TaxID=34305 RepID=I3T5Y2_LOTJA|nr:unknown [Lotus japonicus]